MTIALYCRVSTDEQAQHGFSIDHQKERLAAFCESQGWKDYEHYVDDGYTGTNLNRPQLTRLIRHIRSGRVNMVVVYKIDRLSRKLRDALYLLEDVFEANGAAFRSATEPFDTSTPIGKAMLGILAVFAQLERDTIVERSRTGKRQRTRRGLWYGGPIPYGYEWSTEQQRLIVVPQQADLVREMFSRVLKGQSYTSIGRWLDKREKGRFFSHHKTFLYMVTNPIYMGKLNYDGNLVDGLHDPIVDEETWYAVQEEIRKRKKGRSPYGRYLLSNLLICGECGSTMKHIHYKRDNGRSEHNYYLCSSKHAGHSSCSNRYFKRDELEASVIRALQDEATIDPELLREELRERNTDNDIDQAIASISAEIQSIDDKLERWYTAFENGSIDEAKVVARVNALEEEKKALLTRLDELEMMQPDDTFEEIRTSLYQIRNQWENLNETERSMILRTAIHKVTVYKDGRLEFDWN
ncbi:recombinase family protein [Alicyclobacillus pomorum]|uniref:recombinase family protein n=1 Tax=Alicyclobacillus pomorum TaxID=204470 RepID=UPI00041052AB|nr:recombinase family protein [Alicyclobacillus pomorum]